MATTISNGEANNSILRSIVQGMNDHNLPVFIKTLTHLSANEKCRVVNKIDPANERSLFFTACCKGLTSFVRYMLQKCGADIEQRGLYELATANFKDKVAPLWAATAEKHLELVKVLIANGAKINTTTSTNSSPVRAACYHGHFQLVKYLIENGADINQKNIYGGTCLMVATQGKLQICQLLLQRGSSIDETDIDGETSLHFAIRDGRLDLVSFFLDKSADVYLTNAKGEDALQTAAIYGQKYILEFLVKDTIYKMENVIHAYELLGSYYVDETEEFEQALYLWRRAMKMRWKDPRFPIEKPLTTPSRVFANSKEPVTIEQMDRLREDNLDDLRMYSLLTRERILGPSHRETLERLCHRGAVYADNNHHQRCIDLWLHGIISRKQYYPITDEDLCTDIAFTMEIFAETQKDITPQGSEETIRIEDVLQLTELIVEVISEYVQSMKFRPLTKNFYPHLETLMKCFLHCSKFILDNYTLSTAECDELEELTKKMLATRARTESMENVFLLSLKSKTSKLDDTDLFRFPSVPVVKFLLQCGASIDVFDIEKNGPLHCCLELLHGDEESIGRELVTLLISLGAHVDVRNVFGVQPIDLLLSAGFPICPVQHGTLSVLQQM